jgi:nucleoid-associated protein YgaU
MTSRYTNTRSFINNLPEYENVLEDRGVNYIQQYRSPAYKQLTEDQLASLTEGTYSWQVGDRLEKISSRVYNDPQYWWIIARYNNKPTDAHFKRGDTVRIPQPLNLILSYYTE